MAIYVQRKLNQKINSLVFFLVQRTFRLFNSEFSRQLSFGMHWPEILSKFGQKRTIFDLSKVAIFTLFMGASPIAMAYGLSIPDDPINDGVIVRLQTTSVVPEFSAPSDNEITNWWVEAGSTGFGSGRNDYFRSGSLEAPVMTNLFGTADLPSAEAQGGTSNALVTNLPMDGDLVFLSIWIKRQDQPWERELISVITSSSSTTPTTIVERFRYKLKAYEFGTLVWRSTSMASWYQIWINDRDGTNVHKKWYSYKEVCMTTQAHIAADCATREPSLPSEGKAWVRAWSVHGGHGPWSQSLTNNDSEKSSYGQ